MKAKIQVIRDIKIPEMITGGKTLSTLLKSGDEEDVYIHHIGVRGGFERYPNDNTMDGSIEPIAIVQVIKTGHVIPIEIGFQANLISKDVPKIHQA